jgi:hypothetical protein
MGTPLSPTEGSRFRPVSADVGSSGTGRPPDWDDREAPIDVDSIAVIIKTAPNSSRNMGLAAYLIVSGVRGLYFLLTFKNYVVERDVFTEDADPIGKPYPYLEPGQTNRLTVVAEKLKLSDITGAAILLGDDPYPNAPSRIRRRYGRSWSPDWVALEINGQLVHTAQLFGQKIGPGGHVDLGWPSTDPTFTPPDVVVPKVRRVRKLGRFARTPNIPGSTPPH